MDPARRIITAATRPLGDNHELLAQAEAELAQAIEQGGADEAFLTAVAERMEAKPRLPFVVRATLTLMLLLLSGWLVSEPVRAGFKMIGSISEGFFGFLDIKINVPEHLTDRQKLLFGHYPTRVERSLKLWRSEPENPAYLANAIGNAEVITPEMREAAARVDPQNGYFDLHIAAQLYDGIVEKKSNGKGKPRTIIIKDQAKLDEALALVRTGLEKPNFNTYHNQLFRERVAAVPEADEDVIRRTWRVALLIEGNNVMALRKVCDLLDAAAWQCAQRKDIAGFRAITAQWEKLAERLIENGGSLVNMLVARMAMSGFELRHRATELGLSEEAARLQKLHDEVTAAKTKRDKGGVPWGDKASFKAGGPYGITIPLLARQSSHPREPTAAELTPGRLASHSFLERVLAIPLWLLFLLLAAGSALVVRFRSRLARALSASTVKLLDGKDRAFIIAGGVVFSLLWYALFTRLTPLSAREYAPGFLECIPVVGQAVSLLLTLIILPIVISSTLLARRGKSLGLRLRHGWIGRIAATLALVCVPVFGALHHMPEMKTVYAVSALAGFPLLWLVWETFLLFIAGRQEVLRRITLARTLVPVWITASVAVSLATLPIHREEKMWVRYDQLSNIAPDSMGATSYENEISAQVRDELRKTLADFRAP